jgi:Fe-S-cluster-containing dehydrogenase component/DMSO reductase anchor subunit
MSSTVTLEVSVAEKFAERANSRTLLELLLEEQQQTAVERFSQWHEDTATPLQARHYRDLIPLSKPAAGEQYAFEVDLDKCSGCKACVAACHNLNGLEDAELWRSVGLLHGGTTQLPVLQHVTTACHHCLEPACLEGCPVEAYEKDPVTGIVRHLDDQCIGCQYCILKCPYDVPKYSRTKGIVRKCDMCSNRLAVGEAPACVQACPTQAIRVTIVNQLEIAENAEANLFLPGAPEPGYTLPSTVYKTRKALPANLLPANYYTATPQHAHLPLVVMLVMTQMSVGAFLVEQWLRATQTSAETSAHTIHLAAAFVLGMIGLTASVFHLGRPWLAYRAVMGWKTSWLSREVIAFGAFALFASLYAGLPWLPIERISNDRHVERGLGLLVVLSGLAGVLCSTMIYASTRRVFWNPIYTGLKFLLTCLVLGLPVALLLQRVTAPSEASTTNVLAAALIIVSITKLLSEAAVFGWSKSRRFTPMRRTALLMTGDLRRVTTWRFLLGIGGGILLPALLLNSSTSVANQLFVFACAILTLALCVSGELLERYLFFAAVVAPKMPGAPAT